MRDLMFWLRRAAVLAALTVFVAHFAPQYAELADRQVRTLTLIKFASIWVFGLTSLACILDWKVFVMEANAPWFRLH